MSKVEEDKIIESDNLAITKEAKQLVENLQSYRNKLPVETVKTLTLLKPKQPRKPETVKKEKEVIKSYKKGQGIIKQSHKGIIALKELLWH